MRDSASRMNLLLLKDQEKAARGALELLLTTPADYQSGPLSLLKVSVQTGAVESR